jgi:hypothetical protein
VVHHGFRFAIVTAGLLLSAQAALAESRVALVIGQSAYRAVPALTNPVNDARAMTQLLTDAGFDVVTASDLSQNEMREKVSDFAGRITTKGPDTVALVFYAGHGLQIDGENFLVPVDVDPKREADVPLQSVRLNDILNTLTSVPSKMRIVMLDACRNNPFPDISKSAGRGLAIVDARFGAAGTFLSFSTSPGAEAEDGDGANSPYTTALLLAAREPGLSIEDAFKRVRVSVNKATGGRQTPWESSSLTGDFRFFGGQSTADAKPAAVKRSLEQWRQELRGKPVESAHDTIVGDGSVDAYQAFVELFAEPPFAPQARQWLDRHRRMQAWNRAVVENTAAGYRAFLAAYPDSDLTATARKLEERLRNRPIVADVAAVGVGAANAAAPAGSSSLPVVPANASSASTCPCNAPAPKKDDTKKRASTEPPKRGAPKPPPRWRGAPPPDIVYDDGPAPPPYVRGGVITVIPGGGMRGGGGYGGYGGSVGGSSNTRR